jgi:uncharacterized SAM-binding protein YcdF (DUF218 family)
MTLFLILCAVLGAFLANKYRRTEVLWCILCGIVPLLLFLLLILGERELTVEEKARKKIAEEIEQAELNKKLKELRG